MHSTRGPDHKSNSHTKFPHDRLHEGLQLPTGPGQGDKNVKLKGGYHQAQLLKTSSS